MWTSYPMAPASDGPTRAAQSARATRARLSSRRSRPTRPRRRATARGTSGGRARSRPPAETVMVRPCRSARRWHREGVGEQPSPRASADRCRADDAEAWHGRPPAGRRHRARRTRTAGRRADVACRGGAGRPEVQAGRADGTGPGRARRWSARPEGVAGGTGRARRWPPAGRGGARLPAVGRAVTVGTVGAPLGASGRPTAPAPRRPSDPRRRCGLGGGWPGGRPRRPRRRPLDGRRGRRAGPAARSARTDGSGPRTRQACRRRRPRPR